MPPPAQAPIAGSLLLARIGPGNDYAGRWDFGFDYFDCRFHYDVPTAEGWAEAFWSAGLTSDHGLYSEEAITLPPILHYLSVRVAADNWDWFTRLLVTS